MNITISDKFIYLWAGCCIGLVLGALLSPNSGETTRRNLSNKVDDLGHRVMEKGKNIAIIGRPAKINQSIENDDLIER